MFGHHMTAAPMQNFDCWYQAGAEQRRLSL
jgi:hypothetical protein